MPYASTNAAWPHIASGWSLSPQRLAWVAAAAATPVTRATLSQRHQCSGPKRPPSLRQPVVRARGASLRQSAAITAFTALPIFTGSTPAWALTAVTTQADLWRALESILSPLLAVYIFLFLVRIILTWFPQMDVRRMPWNVSVLATEWVLKPTRRLLPPEGGVDLSPIVWLALISLARELLVGSQGIIRLLIIQNS